MIRRWRDRFPRRPLAVALTGTDLYRDLPDDPEARDSLMLADRLIVLQADAVNALPPAHRGKARVVYQSARRLAPALKPAARLNCVMVGHLRAEKDPGTGWGAWAHLPPDAPIRLDVIGRALDEKLEQARALSSRRAARALARSTSSRLDPAGDQARRTCSSFPPGWRVAPMSSSRP